MDKGFEGHNSIQNINKDSGNSNAKTHREIKKIIQSVKGYEKRYSGYDNLPSESKVVEADLIQFQSVGSEPVQITEQMNQETIIDAAYEQNKKPRLRLRRRREEISGTGIETPRPGFRFRNKPAEEIVQFEEVEGTPEFEPEYISETFEDAKEPFIKKLKLPPHKEIEPATFKIRFNEEGKLENIDFIKPKKKSETDSKLKKTLKVDKIISIIKRKGKKGEGGEQPKAEEGKGGKLSKILGPLSKITSIKDKLPILGKGKKSKKE